MRNCAKGIAIGQETEAQKLKTGFAFVPPRRPNDTRIIIHLPPSPSLSLLKSHRSLLLLCSYDSHFRAAKLPFLPYKLLDFSKQGADLHVWKCCALQGECRTPLFLSFSSSRTFSECRENSLLGLRGADALIPNSFAFFNPKPSILFFI